MSNIILKKYLEKYFYGPMYSVGSAGGSLPRFFVLSIESSQVSKIGQVVGDLTLESVELSKILVYSVRDRNILFSYTPPLDDFKNANEILVVGTDLYIVYYWNSADNTQKSKLVKFTNYKIDLINNTIIYDNIDTVDIGINAIHGTAVDSKYIYFSSRNERKFARVGIDADIADIEVYDLNPIAYYSGSDTMGVYNDDIYLPTFDLVGGQYFPRIFTVGVNQPTVKKPELIKMVGSFAQYVAPLMFVHDGYAYATEHWFGYNNFWLLNRINLINREVKVIRIETELPGDPHAFTVDPSTNKMYITTARNPQLVTIDLYDFKQVGTHIVKAAQVADPMSNGYYGSPETGYITDDIVYGGGYLYMGIEMGKPGFLVMNIYDFNDVLFFPTTYDVFGSVYTLPQLVY